MKESAELLLALRPIRIAMSIAAPELGHARVEGASR